MSLENQENRKTKHHIPHSGSDHLPDEVIERPIRETPNVPLESVAGRVPDSPYDGFESLPPTDRERMLFDQGKTDVRNSYLTDTQEHKKSKKGLIIGVSAVAASAIAAGGIWLGTSVSAKNNEGTPPVAEPTAEAPVTPGPSLGPTVAPTAPVETTQPTTPPAESSAPAETNKAGEYTASQLLEMPFAEFETLPFDTRMILVKDMLKYSSEWDLFKFGAGLDEEDTSDLYKFNPLDVASPNNTPEEIAKQDVYMQQLALTQTVERGLGTFDPDNAAKALSGAYTDIEFVKTGNEVLTEKNNSLYRDMKANLYKLPDVTTHEYAHEVSNVVVQESRDLRDDAGNEIEYREIQYTTGELPETLGDFAANRKLVVTKKFVWHEDANMWLSISGGIMQLPANYQG